MNASQELREQFRNEGVTIAVWARKNGFRPDEVYAALSGRTRGDRGRAHKVAVALGLKPRPSARLGNLEGDCAM